MTDPLALSVAPLAAPLAAPEAGLHPGLHLGLIGSFSIWHWLIVLVVVLVLFGGKGKISSIMHDVGLGVNQFRKGLKEEESSESAKGGQLEAQDKSES